jgi:hypothetical protein
VRSLLRPHLPCLFLQGQLHEAQVQLEAHQASLKDATSDRDMFLRRLQQLEQQQDDPAVPRPLSRLETQRQKANAAQVQPEVAHEHLQWILGRGMDADGTVCMMRGSARVA